MNIRASLLFARSLIFPRSALNSSARKSIIGAIVCIGISVIPLVAVISVTNGMVNGMTDRMIKLSSGHLQFFISKSSDAIKSKENLKEFADSFYLYDEIKEAYPEIDTNALAQGKSMRCGVQVRAVVPEIFEKNEGFKKYFKFIEGSAEDFIDAANDNKKTCIIGKKIADDLKLSCGDNIRIITTKEKNLGILVPELTSCKVSAIVSSGYQELDAFWVFVPVSSAFSYANKRNSSFSVILNTENAFGPELSAVQDSINSDYFGKGVSYRWDEVNASELENFSSTKILLVFIMIMIVLVASVNISSALIMLVMERQKEIGIIKSLGGTSRGITLSFILTGGFCGFCGLLIGLPAGILGSVFANQLVHGLEWFINIFTRNDVELLNPAYYLTEIPVAIPVKELAVISVLVLVLSVLVSIIPSVKGGKQKPLEILRKV